MTFDPKESLSFNGNTGPYLQYTGARIQSMLRKFDERRERYAAGRLKPELLTLPGEWEILKMAALFPETVAVAARELSPSNVAVHLFELSKSFSRWYQENPVLRNEDPDLVVTRIALVRAVVQVLKNGLQPAGDAVPRGHVTESVASRSPYRSRHPSRNRARPSTSGSR